MEITDNKQKAIVILNEALSTQFNHGRVQSIVKRTDLLEATILYDSIAPLMQGEFPEGQVVRAVNKHIKFMSDFGYCAEGFIVDIKRIWEDEDRRSGGERREPYKYFRGNLTDDYFPNEVRRVYTRPGQGVGWIYDRRILKDRRKVEKDK